MPRRDIAARDRAQPVDFTKGEPVLLSAAEVPAGRSAPISPKRRREEFRPSWLKTYFTATYESACALIWLGISPAFEGIAFSNQQVYRKEKNHYELNSLSNPWCGDVAFA
jgi:hypothetical protein